MGNEFSPSIRTIESAKMFRFQRGRYRSIEVRFDLAADALGCPVANDRARQRAGLLSEAIGAMLLNGCHSGALGSAAVGSGLFSYGDQE